MHPKDLSVFRKACLRKDRRALVIQIDHQRHNAHRDRQQDQPQRRNHNVKQPFHKAITQTAAGLDFAVAQRLRHAGRKQPQRTIIKFQDGIFCHALRIFLQGGQSDLRYLFFCQIGFFITHFPYSLFHPKNTTILIISYPTDLVNWKMLIFHKTAQKSGYRSTRFSLF